MDTPWRDPFVIHHSRRLLDSWRRWLGTDLVSIDDDPARALFEAPLVVVSHGGEADPVLNYGNRRALELWEMSWDEFVHTPSRLTAEAEQRDTRARILEETARNGFATGYSGVRISRNGKRFIIEDVVLWNVLDEGGKAIGQAAVFPSWRPLE